MAFARESFVQLLVAATELPVSNGDAADCWAGMARQPARVLASARNSAVQSSPAATVFRAIAVWEFGQRKRSLEAGEFKGSVFGRCRRFFLPTPALLRTDGTAVASRFQLYNLVRLALNLAREDSFAGALFFRAQHLRLSLSETCRTVHVELVEYGMMNTGDHAQRVLQRSGPVWRTRDWCALKGAMFC